MAIHPLLKPEHARDWKMSFQEATNLVHFCNTLLCLTCNLQIQDGTYSVTTLLTIAICLSPPILIDPKHPPPG